MQLQRIEQQGIPFYRITVKGAQRDVPCERVQAKGLVQCLEDMGAPPTMIDAVRKYAADGGY